MRWRARSDPIWQLSVFTPPEREEAVAEFLGDFFGTAASSYSDFETGKTTVSVYLQDRHCPSAKQRSTLKRALAEMEKGAPGQQPLSLSVRRIRKQDWAHSWKLHFKPIEIGSRLLIKPSWSRKRARPGQKVIILDPGLSFGTGQHPTTLFCIGQVVRMRGKSAQRSFLDIGTGSGILAISAAKLGYSPIEAFDYDAKAVAIARQNARRNRVLHKINLRVQDMTTLPRQSRKQYNVICANLLANLLIQERDRLVNRVAPGGLLVLAGILEKEFTSVAQAYETAGMRLGSARTRGEWRSGSFLKKF
jgi:ribosomal protein L11 methyltransferase